MACEVGAANFCCELEVNPAMVQWAARKGGVDGAVYRYNRQGRSQRSTAPDGGIAFFAPRDNLAPILAPDGPKRYETRRDYE
jgi:hypothetical protein